jgi:hypothetical protein
MLMNRENNQAENGKIITGRIDQISRITNATE